MQCEIIVLCHNSAFLLSFCLRVVPRFGGDVNINKPLAACNGTSTQYMLFSAINGRVLVLIYLKKKLSFDFSFGNMERDFAAYLFTLFCPLFTSGASFSIAHEYSVRNLNSVSRNVTR